MVVTAVAAETFVLLLYCYIACDCTWMYCCCVALYVAMASCGKKKLFSAYSSSLFQPDVVVV